MKKIATICFITGKTGGHFFPALALAKDLSSQGRFRLFFITSDSGLDKKILLKNNSRVFPFSLPNSRSLFSFLTFFYSLFSLCIFFLKEKPKLIVGFGGIISFYVGVLSSILRIPYLFAELNVYPGKANRILKHVAQYIFLAYRPLLSFFPSSKSLVTGVPIRQDIFNYTRENSLKNLSFDSQKKTLLVMGGSQGAHMINVLFTKSINSLKKWHNHLQIIHITGENDYFWIKTITADCSLTYRTFSFVEDIGKLLVMTDLYLGRAGGSISAELIAYHIPALYIPFPYAKDNHQEKNARYFSRLRICQWIQERDVTETVIVTQLEKLLFTHNGLTPLKNNLKNLSITSANKKIVKKLLSLL
ncbi:glycosyltransferase [Chlamydiota bacterium]